MHEQCECCQLTFAREPGFYLGSIYFNYGLTSLLMTAAFLSLFLGFDVSPDKLVWPLTGFCLLFPLWFFRYARSLWFGMDYYFDPQHRSGRLQPPPV